MRPEIVLFALALSAQGCALSSKGEPLSPRYFSPDLGQSSTATRAAPELPLELRLGQMGAASYLEERIAYRLSETELGYYDDRRWTEPPEEFLRRALGRELFEGRRLRRVVSGVAPTLDVELVSFEELRYGASRARVTLRFALADERHARLERVITIEQPIADGDVKAAPVRVAVAMSRALSRAVAEVADAVIAELAPRSAPARGEAASAPQP
jgi:cholesterol transport system auxiliary component